MKYRDAIKRFLLCADAYCSQTGTVGKTESIVFDDKKYIVLEADAEAFRKMLEKDWAPWPGNIKPKPLQHCIVTCKQKNGMLWVSDAYYCEKKKHMEVYDPFCEWEGPGFYRITPESSWRMDCVIAWTSDVEDYQEAEK